MSLTKQISGSLYKLIYCCDPYARYSIYWQLKSWCILKCCVSFNIHSSAVTSRLKETCCPLWLAKPALNSHLTERKGIVLKTNVTQTGYYKDPILFCENSLINDMWQIRDLNRVPLLPAALFRWLLKWWHQIKMIQMAERERASERESERTDGI